MQYPVCRHIKTNGTRCKSPAMNESTWCFFHARMHQRHSSYRFVGKASGSLRHGTDLQLCVLEDRESVLLSLSLVVNALSTGNLEPSRARTLLYGLQLASQITARPTPQVLPEDVVRSTTLDSADLDLSDSEDLKHSEGKNQDISEREEISTSKVLDLPKDEDLPKRNLPKKEVLHLGDGKVQAVPEALNQSTPKENKLPSHQYFDLHRVRSAPSEPIINISESINERLADDRNRHCVKFA